MRIKEFRTRMEKERGVAPEMKRMMLDKKGRVCGSQQMVAAQQWQRIIWWHW